MSIDNLNEKIAWLNARNAEYEKGHPTVSDKEWDDVYFGLKKVMPKTLDIPANPITSVSPTFNQTAVNELLKIEHNHEMLSLDKTKSMFEVLAFLNNHDYIAMAKMDGLTCSLRYVDGKLVSAETRGNGYIGEDITHNARVINTIPKNIDYEGELVVDGEVISTYANFESFIGLYRNPRNFAAGSIRLLDSRECAKRGLTFIAWDLIKYNEEFTTFMEKLIKLEELGFKVVPWSVDNDLAKVVENIQSEASLRSFPIDGVVFKFNDLAYGDAQGKTTHHFKNAIAYKFYDDLYPAVLRSIEWTMGRTGVLTPVAIFDPIEMDGSVVSRASLHNVSTMEEILDKPFDGEEIQVFKANMIIPQVSSANKEPGDNPKYIKMIEKCPICGEKLEIRVNGDVKELYCANENCAGKILNQFDHFCGKKGFDIRGLSKATLEKLLDWGWIEQFHDIFLLKQYRLEWGKKPGFGAKSVTNILEAIEKSRSITLEKFISSLGIPLIGETVSKDICKHISTYEDFKSKCMNHFDFTKWDGFADSKTKSLWNYDFTEANEIYKFIEIVQEEKKELDQTLEGKIIVITGRLTEFKNRNELQAAIEARGGKVVNSISKRTNYLINNDIESNSAKNKAAKDNGIPIIAEADFKAQFID